MEPPVVGRVVSVNVGQARDVEYNGRRVVTGIFKTPIHGRINIRVLGLEGDVQADLTVHGGPQKAVYAYPSENYEYWHKEIESELTYGMFGENLTTGGLVEEFIHLGDRFSIGTTELVVTQPRFPCYKLGIKFGAMEMVKKFQDSGRSGFYMAVSKEGQVGTGDSIRLTERSSKSPTVTEVFNDVE